MSNVLKLALSSAIAVIGIGLSSAEAVVYCRTVGVPKGCVVRPAVRPAVVYCTAPGLPVGCVVRPAVRPVARPVARRAVVRPGPGVNLGGPVNRPGLR